MTAAPFPTAAPDAAELYLERGFAPLPLDGPRTKKVTRDAAFVAAVKDLVWH